MNLDGKRSVNNIISSFCPENVEAINRHILSVEGSNENSSEVVLYNSKRFKVILITHAMFNHNVQFLD